MKSLFKIYILIPLLYFVMALPSRAQTNWDQALDKYEEICDRCIELRDMVADGKPVSSSSVTTLLQELNSLRTRLQGAEGSMSKAQRQRFTRIRDKYSRAYSSATSSRKDNTRATVRNATEKPAVSQQVVEEAKDTISRVSLELAKVEEIIGSLQSPRQAFTPKREIQEAAAEDAGEAVVKNWRYGMSADAVICSPVCFGATLFATYRKVGAFVALSSDFRYHGTAYSCASDGSLSEGGSFWGNGIYAVHRSMVLAGPMYDLGHGFSIFAGVGYGSSSTTWQDVDSAWAKVEDLNFKGIIAGAGAVKAFGHIAVSASIRYLPSGREIYPAAGIGVAF